MGPLEAKVMDLVWTNDEVSVREVWRVLSKDSEVAYTTVMTIFHRLHEKGYLERRSQGRAHLYRPRESRQEFQEGVLARIVRGVIHQVRGTQALGVLGKLGKKDRALLRRMLEQSEG